jgi:hypothetical protein
MTRTTGRPARSIALLLMLVVAFLALSVTSAFAISRNTVLSRAQNWVDYPTRYSQSRYHLGYRTDCSGYVSMCWHTHSSYSTRSFHVVSHTIKKDDLKPGDALLKPNYHIRLFYGWLDDAHTEYVAYESGTSYVLKKSVVSVARRHSIDEDLAFGYKPTRYDHISNSPASRNLLQNGSFNTWVQGWSGEEVPWWEIEGAQWRQPTVVHRTHASARTGLHALELLNTSDDPSQYTEISQTASITPEVPYRASAWAATASDAKNVELSVDYLNALGESVAEQSIGGDEAGIDETSYKRLSVLSTPPVDAVRAKVTVRLAGGSTLDASGTPVPGTSVLLDDLSIYRPFVSASIKSSAASTYRGRKITLGGSVTPTSTIGQAATVYVKKPGATTWVAVPSVSINAAGSVAVWNHTYAFSKTAKRGTYQFKASFPAVPGYVGYTTSIVSVKLK